MRKDETIQIHGLLRTLKQHVEVKYGISEEVFEEYKELNVKPEHVYKNKDRHQMAVMLLSQKIADELAKEGSYSPDEEEREPIAA